MTNWKRVKSATEWGLFYGVVSWILATGPWRKMPVWAVWSLIISRTLLGFIIGYVRWEVRWWIRGMVLGLVVSLPVGIGFRLMEIPWGYGFWLTILSGMVVGVLIELSQRPKKSKRTETGHP